MDRRRNGVWERLGAPVSDDTGESADAVYRRLGREAIDTERQTFVELRDSGRIDDELYRRLVHQLDLEEALVAHQDE
jgi:CPA1 family monovalent cation:H+ antiporter